MAADERAAESHCPSEVRPKGWSIYGAERTQPVAIGGECESRENGSNKPNPLPPIADSCGTTKW